MNVMSHLEQEIIEDYTIEQISNKSKGYVNILSMLNKIIKSTI